MAAVIRSPRTARWGLVGAVVLSLLLVGGPGAPVGSTAARGLGVESGFTPANESGLSVNVTWEDVGVSYANGPPTAFALGPGASAVVDFSYVVAPSASPPTNATLVLRYLGVTLSTESIRAATVCPLVSEPRPLPCTGSAELNWTFGSLIYLTAGVFAVDAELLSYNGTLLFREPFYIDAEAPYVLGSLTIVFALVLGAAEAYWIVASIRYRLRRRNWRFRR
jgi:hypothetical protein